MKCKIPFELKTSNVKIVYQKVNKIVTSLEYLFPEKKQDLAEKIAIGCYNNVIFEECFEKQAQKIKEKDPTMYSILEAGPANNNFKKMQMYNYIKQLFIHNNLRLDECIWNLLECVLNCKLIVIEKNMLPSRQDAPTYKIYLENNILTDIGIGNDIGNDNGIDNGITKAKEKEMEMKIGQEVKEAREEKYLLFDPTTFEYYPLLFSQSN